MSDFRRVAFIASWQADLIGVDLGFRPVNIGENEQNEEKSGRDALNAGILTFGTELIFKKTAGSGGWKCLKPL
jgi:hypothetical protein